MNDFIFHYFHSVCKGLYVFCIFFLFNTDYSIVMNFIIVLIYQLYNGLIIKINCLIMYNYLGIFHSPRFIIVSE